MKSKILIIHWLPRILCIVAILFISMFALDSFEPGLSIWQQLAAFAIHLVPSFLLLTILLIAWKWEYIGGIVFLAIGLGFTPFIYSHNYAMNHSVWKSLLVILLITFPFMVTGALFILSNFLTKRLRSKE